MAESQIVHIDPSFAFLAWWPAAWHAAAVALAWWLPPPWAMPAALAWVLLLPPLLCQTTAWLWPATGEMPASSASARLWWWQQQLQAPFNRLTFIEEIFRLVPGLYQAWLALWGGRAHPFCFFAAGSVVTDRQSVAVGRGAVIGGGAILGGHAVLRRDGRWIIAVGTVRIGPAAVVGARCVLGPGSEIGAGEELPATLPLPPFQRWLDGRRHKGSN